MLDNKDPTAKKIHLKKHHIFRATKGDSVKWSMTTGGKCVYCFIIYQIASSHLSQLSTLSSFPKAQIPLPTSKRKV